MNDSSFAPPDSGRVAVLARPGAPFELRSFPLPEPAPGETLVRIRATTLCGSDLHSFEGRRATPLPGVLGHESIGEIVATGEGEIVDLDGRSLRAGDRVTWTIARSCGHCFPCEAGLPQKCDDLEKFGHGALDAARPFRGGLAEFTLLEPGTSIVRLPREIPDALACPASCATATITAALRRLEPESGERFLVTGAGLLGLTAVAMLRARGAAEVLVVDRDPARLALAPRFGATSMATSDLLAAGVERLTDGRGIDGVVETTGSPEVTQGALASLRTGGRLVLVGAVYPSPPLELSAEDVVRRCLRIEGIHNYTPRDLADAVAFLARDPESSPLADAVGATFSLDEVDAAVRHALEAKPLRVMVRCDARANAQSV